MTRVLTWPIIALAFLSLSPASVAQDAIKDWPTRTVRIYIPLGAGGGGDIFSRLLAEELQKKFGQSFIVENRPGGPEPLVLGPLCPEPGGELARVADHDQVDVGPVPLQQQVADRAPDEIDRRRRHIGNPRELRVGGLDRLPEVLGGHQGR